MSFKDMLEENRDLFTVIRYDDMQEQRQQSEQDHVRMMTNTEDSASVSDVDL